MKKIYYAHCMAIYNTKQEERDIHLLKELGFIVMNPNQKHHQQGAAEKGMDYFERVVKDCDVLAFRANPDGKIPAGIYKEIEWAKEVGYPVIELPSMVISRELSVDETRQYLMEAGLR